MLRGFFSVTLGPDTVGDLGTSAYATSIYICRSMKVRHTEAGE